MVLCRVSESEAPDSRVSSSNYASSNYATLGRPVSLPISRQQRVLSSSDPDLTSSNPASPDNDVSTYSGQCSPPVIVVGLVCCFVSKSGCDVAMYTSNTYIYSWATIIHGLWAGVLERSSSQAPRPWSVLWVIPSANQDCSVCCLLILLIAICTIVTLPVKCCVLHSCYYSAPHFTLVKEALIEIGCVVTSLVVGRWLVVTRVHCGQTVHPRPIVTMEH